MATTLESPSRVTAPVAAAPVPPRRPWRPVAVLVVLAWAVPGTTHLLGIDWLLPPLVLVATASLLRVGRTLLDRLMLALCLLLIVKGMRVVEVGAGQQLLGTPFTAALPN